MQPHTNSDDPDVLEAIDDLTVAALEIQWLTERYVGMAFGDPQRAAIGRKVDLIMRDFEERAVALHLTTGVLFEIVSSALPKPTARAA